MWQKNPKFNFTMLPDEDAEDESFKQMWEILLSEDTQSMCRMM